MIVVVCDAVLSVTSSPGVAQSVVMNVRLFVHSYELKITQLNFTKFSLHVDYGCGSVLLRRHCYTIYTSSFVDDVMFSHNGPMVHHVYF